jgi:N-acetylmuramoyl-L-alanine amidase
VQAVPFSFGASFGSRGLQREFGILPAVKNRAANSFMKFQSTRCRPVAFASLIVFIVAMATIAQIPGQSPPTVAPISPQGIPVAPAPTFSPRPGLNIVVLDPAHGGTDTGARGTAGIRESEVVLGFAAQVRRALESQGFQVVQTRLADENPSFDDRSTLANAQSGAVFVTLHVSSTGLPGTARVYVNSDLPTGRESNGLIPWDRAQAPFLGLSHKFGDMVQANLAQKFKGSPGSAQTCPIRQLRTTAAPAIAVEISSVTVTDRADLDRMAPGIADAIARGAAAFRPSYVVASQSGALR